MKKKCLWCNKNTVSLFGIYDEDSNTCEPCLVLSYRRDNDPTYGEYSRHAQAERNAYSKDILQPMKKDGTVNKHFVQAHGTKSIEKELKTTRKAIMENVEKYG